MTNKFVILTNNIVRIILFVIFSIFAIINLCISPMYDINTDSPYFVNKGIINYCFIILFILFFIALARYKEFIEKKINIRVVTIIYFLLGLIYILLIPLKPFSDMQYINEGAIQISQFNFDFIKYSEYFNKSPNNIMITLIYGICYIIFPKSIVVIKIINILCILLTACIGSKLYKIFSQRYSKLVFVILLSINSIFLYANFIYGDIFFNLITLWAVYLYIKSASNLPKVMFLLGFSMSIRATGIIYIIAVMFDYILKRNVVNKKKKYITFIISILTLFVSVVGIKLILLSFDDVNQKSLPVSSYIYIGLNRDKFGFQDQSHDVDRNIADINVRIDEYGIKEIAKIFMKKSYWTWMEGTYQASRYAFGNNVIDSLEKYQYDTPLTKYTLRDDNMFIILLNILMSSQYYVLFLLMLVAILKNKSENLDVINLLFFGHFLFYLIWEIKSRYIISLYPYMIIMASIVLLSDSTGNLLHINKKDK